MNHVGGIGNPEAIEISRNCSTSSRRGTPLILSKTRPPSVSCGFQFEPDIGMAQVRNAVEPSRFRAELKNAAVRFSSISGGERVAIEMHRLLVGMARAILIAMFAPPEKLWTVNVATIALQFPQDFFFCECLAFFRAPFSSSTP